MKSIRKAIIIVLIIFCITLLNDIEFYKAISLSVSTGLIWLIIDSFDILKENYDG